MKTCSSSWISEAGVKVILPAIAQPSAGVMLAMDAPASSLPLLAVCPCRYTAGQAANVCWINRRRFSFLLSINSMPGPEMFAGIGLRQGAIIQRHFVDFPFEIGETILPASHEHAAMTMQRGAGNFAGDVG